MHITIIIIVTYRAPLLCHIYIKYKMRALPSILESLAPFRGRLHNFPTSVRVVEVGPRDGLQNEKTHVPVDTKISFINQLSATGLSEVEVTSFVSPKAIPQFTDAHEVYTTVTKVAGVEYPVLTPTMKYYEMAV